MPWGLTLASSVTVVPVTASAAAGTAQAKALVADTRPNVLVTAYDVPRDDVAHFRQDVLGGEERCPLVEITRDPDVDPARAGVPAGGVAMVRPDGHIGFRFPPGRAGALAALDRHLSSYLIPDPAVGPLEEAPRA